MIRRWTIVVAIALASPRVWAFSDSDHDGFPDAVELADDSDRAAFRQWLGVIAEQLWLDEKANRKKTARDCADFLNIIYREALKRHDRDWQAKMGWTSWTSPLPPDIRRYQYPKVPVIGERLFRNESGEFATYATSEALRLYNTTFVSKRIEDARDGDLLFFQHPEQHMPEHGMLVWRRQLLYHTGPTGQEVGRVKRIRISTLSRHPSAQWHPVPENPHFLGVYRWTILQ